MNKPTEPASTMDLAQRVAALFAENQDLIQMVDDLHARFAEIRAITTQTLTTKERAWTALSQIDQIARKGQEG